MRAPIAAIAVAGFVLVSTLVLVGGRSLEQPSISISLDDLPAEIPVSEETELDAVGPTPDEAAPQPASTGATSDPSALERVAPREPLSKLSLALPPKPKTPDEWKGTILHRAVAPSAGVIDAMGYRVAVAGVDPVEADQSCSHGGKDWDCGVYARTAFRAFLRGRSPTCIVPPEPDREMVAADCAIGKQDIGEWLVTNGWARAASGGPYEEAGKKAEEGKIGIFGPPPARSGLPELPRSYPAIDATVRDAPSIQILSPDEGDAPSFATPALPTPQQEPAQ